MPKMTDYMKAEKLLLDYEKLIENSPDLMAMVDRDYRYRFVNTTYSKYHGRSKEELIGRSCVEVLGPDVFEDTVREHLDRAFLNKTIRYEMTCSFRAMGQRELIVTYVPVADAGGIGRVAATMRDVTERKKLERELIRSETRRQGLFQNKPDGSASTALDERFVEANQTLHLFFERSTDALMLSDGITCTDCNQAALWLFGCSKRHELVGLPMDRLSPQLQPDGRVSSEKMREHCSAALREGASRFEWMACNLHGEEFWIQASLTAIPIGGRWAIHMHLSGIEERKRAEKALMELEEELKNKSAELEEVNIALKVLLRHHDDEKKTFQDVIVSNINSLITPYLERLKVSHLTDYQKNYLSVIDSALNEIASPFIRNIGEKHEKFTRVELQVANLIKSGKSTKEIADLLNVSAGTVETHRNSIRKKLGLRHKKVNLQNYFLSD
jgi:PAS domain S-box-containing protein